MIAFYNAPSFAIAAFSVGRVTPKWAATSAFVMLGSDSMASAF